MARPPPVKLIAVLVFVVRSTALLAPVVSVLVAPEKLIVPPVLALTRMPFATPPVALRLPDSVVVPAMRLEMLTTFPAVVLVTEPP